MWGLISPIRTSPHQFILGHTEQLVSELRKDRGIGIEVVDGNKREFTVEVDGRSINSKDGESLRDAGDVAAEIRGAQPATAW